MARMKALVTLCIVSCLADTVWAEVSGVLMPDSPQVCTMEDLTLSYLPNDIADTEDARLHVYGKGGFLGDMNATREVNVTGGYVTFTLHNITRRLNNANIQGCSGTCITTSDSILLKVYEAPRAVRNFSCKVFNYFDGMNCSWELGAVYNWITQHSLKWRIPTYDANWKSCSRPADTFCFWNGTADGNYLMKKIDIIVTLEKPQCDQNMTQTFSVDTSVIVEPAAVTNLNGTVINSTCVEITWTTLLPQYHKKHMVIYESHWNKSQILLTDEFDEATKQLTVCDLHPATIYTFVVMVMPIQGGYWSQPRTISRTTLYDLPSASPEILPWTFCQSPRYCDSLRRPVTIHWLPLPEFHHNGPLHSYTVTAMRVEEVDMVTEEFIDEAPGDRTQVTLNLMCANAYIIIIQPRNIAGYSPKNSTVFIPAVNQVPPQPEFIIERANRSSSNGLTEVTLTLTSVGHNVRPLNYTVFWCVKGEQGTCAEASLNWTTFPASALTLDLHVSVPESLLMGVSMETDAGRSVVTWKSCIYVMYAEPSRKPKNVGVREGSWDLTLLVTWDKIPCEPGQPYIHQYHIRYCNTGQAGICEEFSQATVGSESSSVELKNLEAKRTYSIAVQGVTKTGLVGPLSLYVTGVAVDKSLQPGEIAGIAIGCIAVGCAVLTALVCFLSWIKKKKDELLGRAQIADISQFSGPLLDANHIVKQQSSPCSTGIKRQISNDSGMPSSPQLQQVNELTSTANTPYNSKNVRSYDDCLFDTYLCSSRVSSDIQKLCRDDSGYVTRARVLVTPAENSKLADIRISENTSKSSDSGTWAKTSFRSYSDSLCGSDYFLSGWSDDTQKSGRDANENLTAMYVMTTLKYKLARTITSRTGHAPDQSLESGKYQQASELGSFAEHRDNDTNSDKIRFKIPSISETHQTEGALNELQKQEKDPDESEQIISDKKNRCSHGSQNSRESFKRSGYAKAVPVDSCDESLNDNHDETKLSTNGNRNETKLSTNGNRDETKLSTNGNHDETKLSTNGNRNETKLSTNGNRDETKLSTNGNHDETKLSTNGNRDETKLSTNGNHDETKLSNNSGVLRRIEQSQVFNNQQMPGAIILPILLTAQIKGKDMMTCSLTENIGRLDDTVHVLVRDGTNTDSANFNEHAPSSDESG